MRVPLRAALLAAVVLGLAVPASGQDGDRAAMYRYRTPDGKTHIVTDLTQVPPAYIDQAEPVHVGELERKSAYVETEGSSGPRFPLRAPEVGDLGLLGYVHWSAAGLQGVELGLFAVVYVLLVTGVAYVVSRPISLVIQTSELFVGAVAAVATAVAIDLLLPAGPVVRFAVSGLTASLVLVAVVAKLGEVESPTELAIFGFACLVLDRVLVAALLVWSLQALGLAERPPGPVPVITEADLPALE